MYARESKYIDRVVCTTERETRAKHVCDRGHR